MMDIMGNPISMLLLMLLLLAASGEEISPELIKRIQRTPEALHDIDSRQFEVLTAELLASYGWSVHITPATRDGGFDLFAVSRDISGVWTSWIVECKMYSVDRCVGIDCARALYGVRQTVVPAGMLMLVATSYFSPEVYALKASRYDLELRDLEGVLDWIQRYRPNLNGRLYLADSQVPSECIGMPKANAAATRSSASSGWQG